MMQERILDVVGQNLQPLGILRRGIEVVHRARPHYDKEPMVVTVQYLPDSVAAGEHRLTRLSQSRDGAREPHRGRG